jgi:hypothetical protein
MKVVVISRQSIFDIAIQECGSVNAIFDIARLNNISVTDTLAPGTELQIPTEKSKPDIVRYFSGKGAKLATSIERSTGNDYLLPNIFPISL